MNYRLAVLALLLVLPAWGAQTAPIKKPARPPHQLTSAQLRDIAFDFINALSHFSATVRIGEEEPESPIALMSQMMDDNRWFREGGSLLKQYKTHPNDAIRVAAEGAILGADLATKANEDMLQVMRNASRYSGEELAYRVADYRSRQKEAYMLIARSAPWFSMAFFELPKNEEKPVGPIPYKVTKPDREAILSLIDRLFGDELAAEARGERKNRHNAIVIAVTAVRRNLDGDTYEEAASDRKAADERPE